MNTVKKGNKFENEYLKYLESKGYRCIKALRVTRRTKYGFRNIKTDFWGMFDIIALGGNNIILAQVESSHRHTIKQIVEFATQLPNSRIMYHLVRYEPDKDQWRVYEILVYHIDKYNIAISINTVIYDRDFKHHTTQNTSYTEQPSPNIKGYDIFVDI
ncbi:MAG: hypothetical protein QXE05_06085 [Nitrososphaeria archaeon]